MVIELYKQSIAIYIVNSENNLEKLTEPRKAVTTAKIKGGSLCKQKELKGNVEQLRTMSV